MSGTRNRIVITTVATITGLSCLTDLPRAVAAPAPEVEYMYNVSVRRHFTFTNNDALGYGFGLCEKVEAGIAYADVIGDVKLDVLPNDEASANYVVSYAVGILCPALIWQLRNSAAGYTPPG
jgi:hypothetical protein